jgi:hypothetical protein
MVMAHGFKSEMLAGLVRDGLASAATESMQAGERSRSRECGSQTRDGGHPQHSGMHLTGSAAGKSLVRKACQWLRSTGIGWQNLHCAKLK